MALGLDIARYQTVTDWNAVKNSGVKFIIVKLTDGFGPAPVQRGDLQVGGAHSVDIPVTGYHFAQKGDPVRQARVFKAEINRLEEKFGRPMGVIPALDIENSAGIGLHWTGQEARDFSIAFSREMLKDYPRVLVYANTAELRGMDALRVCREVPGVYIWEANYSSNNGVRHALPANGWAPWRAAHQYTSLGTIPGIAARGVDMNEGNLEILLLNGEDDVSWNEKSGVFSENDPGHEYDMKALVVGSNQKDNENHKILLTIQAKLDALAGTLSDDEAEIIAEIRQGTSLAVSAILAELAKVQTGNIDVEKLADMLKDSLGDAVAQSLGTHLLN